MDGHVDGHTDTHPQPRAVLLLGCFTAFCHEKSPASPCRQTPGAGKKAQGGADAAGALLLRRARE